MSLDRFVEQTELYNLIAFYTQRYEAKYSDILKKNHPNIQLLPKFDNFKVVHALDGAGVVFSAETTLFGADEKQRKREGIVGRNMAMQIVDATTYFISQGVSVDAVPDELRICLAVCHGNSHWTGVMGTVNSYKTFYKEMLEYCTEKQTTTRKLSASDTSFRNKIKNSINEKLGIITEPSKGEVTSEIRTAKKILAHFEPKISLSHYDSLNGKRYFERIDQSLHEYDKTRYFNGPAVHKPCSRQTDNTCGDHTIANLFSLSVFGCLPEINQKDKKITSSFLRRLTDNVNEFLHILADVNKLSSQDNKLVATLIENFEKNDLKATEKNTKNTELEKRINKKIDTLLEHFATQAQLNSPKPLPKNPELNSFEDTVIPTIIPTVISLVNKLYELDASASSSKQENATPLLLINSARLKKGTKKALRIYFADYKGDEPSKLEITKIVATLKAIFNGKQTDLTKDIFKATTDKDLIHQEGIAAGIIAATEAADKDHEKLQKSLNLKAQSELLNDYDDIKKHSGQDVSLGYAQAKLDLLEVFQNYINHDKGLNEFDFNLKKLDSFIEELCGDVHNNKRIKAELYQSSPKDSVSTQYYLKYKHFKDLLELEIKEYKKANLRLAKKFSEQKAYFHKYEAFIKELAIKEMESALSEATNPYIALKKCNELLCKGKTQEILLLNRQSHGEVFLKVLSVIGIFAGIGIFTTLGLMAKRYYDTNGKSVNFFKPLTKTLNENLEKEFHKFMINSKKT